LPDALRPAFAALWNLDLAFADVVATSTDPRLGAIRLAWWRERLEELDRANSAPAEPRLQQVASELLPRWITGAKLSQLEDAWLPLFEPFPWSGAAAEGLKLRGRVLFGIGARLLGGEEKDADEAGALWSLIDGAQHCSDAPSQQMLFGEARSMLQQVRKVPRSVRPLTIIAAVAAADLIGKGAVGRLFAAVRHRVSGGFPR
jgi:15-cis-phytoene synthase